MQQNTTMNKLILFFGLLLTAGYGCAQSKAADGIPPYHILNTDSVFTTPADLKKNEAVLMIYFSPDCGHCQHLMYELKPKMEDLKHVQVIMVTFVQLKAIQTFYRDFDLKKYPNFTVGTEGYTYAVLKYFDVSTTPYIALYDKNRKLVKAWAKAPSIEELDGEVKKL
jgi:thioredoxin-related protein